MRYSRAFLEAKARHRIRQLIQDSAHLLVAINAAAAPLTDASVQAAYLTETRRIGFSDVAIADLAAALSVPVAAMTEYIRDQARQGRAVLSLGDWSLSSDHVRSGAIESRGRTYLLVRFKSSPQTPERSAS